MKIIITVLIVIALGVSLPASRVHAATSSTDFRFTSFTGTYYLNRENTGRSSLLTQENMVVEFPENSTLFGIRRALPETYQGHSLNLKLLRVTDAANNPLTYQTTTSDGNLVIQTGDPAITLSGSQTYQIEYQTYNVVAIYPGHDQFLVDVNGRGWQEPFGSVQAFVHLPNTLASQLIHQPSCYVGYQNQTLNTCTISTQKLATEQVVSAQTTTNLNTQHALVLLFDFKPGTFRLTNTSYVWVFVVSAGLIIIAAALLLLRRHRRSAQAHETLA